MTTLFLLAACSEGEPAPVEVPADAPFVRVRLEAGGLCSFSEPICNGYQELWGDGTFRYRANPEARLEEHAVTVAELDTAATLVLDEALHALLRDGCVPASRAFDTSASTAVQTWDEDLAAFTTGCADAPVVAVWDHLAALAEP